MGALWGESVPFRFAGLADDALQARAPPRLTFLFSGCERQCEPPREQARTAQTSGGCWHRRRWPLVVAISSPPPPLQSVPLALLSRMTLHLRYYFG